MSRANAERTECILLAWKVRIVMSIWTCRKARIRTSDREQIGKIKSLIVAYLSYTDVFGTHSACLIWGNLVFRNAPIGKIRDGADVA